MIDILDFKKKKIAKVDALGELETPTDEQQSEMLVKLQSLLEDLKERVSYYAKRLAEIGDENEALKAENEKLKKSALAELGDRCRTCGSDTCSDADCTD